ncbi:putative glycogen phosphorylase [Hibiscus syriacus]|uniref:Glycogen phosphorylase n=1 Tax=Hibiscus syriacus TaxID=106335 RepID=A0A6A2Y1S4_HIBSY|nr:putative glycogen phosphorylase [Hibiscus syriacus]
MKNVLPPDASGPGGTFFQTGKGPGCSYGGGSGGGMRGGLRASGSMFDEGRKIGQGPRKAAPIEKTLPCSLEVLYEGSTKKMKISREIAEASGYELDNPHHQCDYEEVVPKEGMPIPRNPSRRGNLRIKFNIKFPKRLTTERKSGIKKLAP